MNTPSTCASENDPNPSLAGPNLEQSPLVRGLLEERIPRANSLGSLAGANSMIRKNSKLLEAFRSGSSLGERSILTPVSFSKDSSVAGENEDSFAKSNTPLELKLNSSTIETSLPAKSGHCSQEGSFSQTEESQHSSDLPGHVDIGDDEGFDVIAVKAPSSKLELAKERKRKAQWESDHAKLGRSQRQKQEVSKNFVKTDMRHRTKRMRKGNTRTRTYIRKANAYRTPQQIAADEAKKREEDYQDSLYCEFVPLSDLNKLQHCGEEEEGESDEDRRQLKKMGLADENEEDDDAPLSQLLRGYGEEEEENDTNDFDQTGPEEGEEAREGDDVHVATSLLSEDSHVGGKEESDEACQRSENDQMSASSEEAEKVNNHAVRKQSCENDIKDPPKARRTLPGRAPCVAKRASQGVIRKRSIAKPSGGQPVTTVRTSVRSTTSSSARRSSKKSKMEQAIERRELLAAAAATARAERERVTGNTSLPISHPTVLQRTVKEVFGFEDFRPGQQEAITRICKNESTLLILPTGGGKSLCYQMPAFLFPGLTLVVTPLISLMQDQLVRLPDVLTGATWNSTMSREEVCELMKDIRDQHIKVLFVSPEKLLSPGFWRFMASLPSPGVSFACIDEAHCVSEWSHNFRPAYMRLRWVLEEALNVRAILAITATATAQTAADICGSLGINTTRLIRLSPHRSNLQLTVSRDHDREQALLHLLKSPRYEQCHSIIIYVMLQRQANKLSNFLQNQGFDSQSYHGGKAANVRRNIQDKFMTNKLRIIVATIAFGMGLDKRDVRAVIHYNLPRTFEHYVQEVGRAGRDGRMSYCHAFYSSDDVEKMINLTHSSCIDDFTVQKLVEKVFGDGTSKNACPEVGKYISLPLETLKSELDVTEASIGTILTMLEMSREIGGHVRVVSTLYNTVSVGFHRTHPHDLAKDIDLVKCILLQNNNKTAQEVGGRYILDITRAANMLSVHVADVQRDLVTLKARGEVSLQWKEQCYCVQILKAPKNISELVSLCAGNLHKQESASLAKVKIVSEALRLVSLPSCRDALEILDRKEKQCQGSQKKLAAAASTERGEKYLEEKEEEVSKVEMSGDESAMDADSDVVRDAEDDNDEEVQLRHIIDGYFNAVDDASFEQHLRAFSQCSGATGDQHAHPPHKNASKRSKSH